MTLTVETLLELAMANPINAEIIARLPALGLDQCFLTVGWVTRIGVVSIASWSGYSLFIHRAGLVTAG